MVSNFDYSFYHDLDYVLLVLCYKVFGYSLLTLLYSKYLSTILQ